jgi:hypothetical protein
MMTKLSTYLNTLLHLTSKADEMGLFDEADNVKKSLIKMAQQAQAPGNAYSFFDPTGIPPALYAIIANLNYKINTLDAKVQQQSQQQSAPTTKQISNPEAQQALLQNQNTITPSTLNYVQTPGSTPAPIEIDDGEINV